MRKAYTLIEVIISLSLLVVLMSFISAAIDVHLRLLDASRTQVAEAHLARSILEKIARDIRSTVIAVAEQELTVDQESVSTLLGLGAATGSISAETATEMAESVSTENAVPEEGTVTGTLPGIYGDLNWIQIDTARLPRGESYGTKQVAAQGTTLWDRLSPTKTVLYYLGEDSGTLGPDDPEPESFTDALGGLTDQFSAKYGLFRRQLDRRVAEYALENDLDSEYELQDEPIAPEIESIEFEYYDSDNSQWLTYWDMDEMGKLPIAVRITLVVRRAKISGESARLLSLGSGFDGVRTITYSQTVMLPITYEKPVEEEESESGTTTTTETSS